MFVSKLRVYTYFKVFNSCLEVKSLYYAKSILRCPCFRNLLLNSSIQFPKEICLELLNLRFKRAIDVCSGVIDITVMQ